MSIHPGRLVIGSVPCTVIEERAPSVPLDSTPVQVI